MSYSRRALLVMSILQAACADSSVAPRLQDTVSYQHSKAALIGDLSAPLTIRYLEIGARLVLSSNLGSRSRVVPEVWTSSDTTIVAIEKDGSALYGKRTGSSIVKRFVGGMVMDSMLVRVGVSGPFTMLPSSMLLKVGEEASPTLSVPTPIVRWTVVDSTIAQVSTDGIIRAIRSGITKVAAVSAFGFASDITVNVEQPVQLPSSSVDAPRVLLDTMVQAGRSVQTTRLLRPRSATELQAMLDSAKYGDEIRLAAGTTYTGNFVLRRKTPNPKGWIIIGTDGLLSPAGQRIEPSKYSLPRIEAENPSLPAIRTEGGASGYALTGLDITVRAGATTSYMLVALGSGDADQNATNVPSRILLDRVYVHGTSTLDVRRCIALNSDSTAIVDSWISECHSKGFDAQAIGGWNGRGPYLIHNNRLEGSGENLLFGGSDPTIVNLIPSDITISQNYLYKPQAWQGIWLVKNTIEIKSARRVLIERNVLENNWPDGQVGFSIVLKSVNQGGRAPWSEASNITLRRNLIKNSYSGASLAGKPEAYEAVPMSRIAFIDNLFMGISSAGRLWEVSGVNDIIFEQNTGFGGQYGLLLHAVGGVRFSMRNNIIGIVQGSITNADMVLGGQAVTPGIATLDKFYPGTWIFEGNVLWGVDRRKFPSGNFFAQSISDIGFVGYPEQLDLSSASPFKTALSNGGQPGVNFGEIQMAATKATGGH